MARASAKRAKRARSNARNAQRAVAQEAPQAAVETAVPEPAPKPKPPPATETQRRGFFTRERKQPAQKRPEDTMLFTRLRARSKWVFVLLAAAFAIGFLAFGIGTGGGGIGDVIRDFFGGDSGTTTISELQKQVAENPTDGEAATQLATLLQNAGRFAEATTVLETFTKRVPDNEAALQTLAASYELRARLALQQANALQAQAGGSSFAATAFSFPDSNGFLGALGQDPIQEAISGDVQAEALDLGDQSDAFYVKEIGALERLTKLKPDDATLQYQLASIANSVNLPDKAVAGYERYLELEPEGPLAEQAKEQLDALRALEQQDVQSVEETG